MPDFEIVDKVLVKYSGPAQDVIRIPDGVTGIREYAFRGLDQRLKWGDTFSVWIPDSVKTIEKHAFSWLSHLVSVVLPDNLMEIGPNAFEHSSLKKIEIPDSCVRIGNGAFSFCSNLESVKLPDGLLSIGESVFEKTGLSKVNLPESLTEIRDKAFYNCWSLQSVKMPPALRRIGNQAFSVGNYVCSLDTVQLNEGLEEIGNLAFENVYSLTSVILPSTLKRLGYRAFAGCVDLKDVTVQSRLQSCGAQAFDGCGKLVFHPTKPEYMDPIWATYFEILGKELVRYAGNEETVTVPDGITSLGEKAFLYNSSVRRIMLPEGLEKIKGNFDTGAIRGCTKLRFLVIPESVQEIQWLALSGCSNLLEVTIPLRLVSSHLFGDSGKTVLLHAIDEDHVLHRGLAVFRKHFGGVFFPQKDEDYVIYDKALATGSYENQALNEDCRIKACLWRLEKTELPVEPGVLVGIVDFLRSHITKAVKIVSEDHAPQYITLLVNIGAIDDDNRKKVSNALKKSDIPEIAAMADRLIPAENTQQEGKQEEDELDRKLKKSKAVSRLMKAGIIDVPDVLLADGSGYADKRILKYMLSEYISIFDEYECRFSSDADKEAKALDRDSLNQALMSIYTSCYNDKRGQSILMPVFRFADGVSVTKLYQALAKAKWRQQAVNKALLVSDTREAMLFADKQGILDRYAELRGKTEDIFRDTVLSEFDLDENGEKVYDLGTEYVKAVLKDDLSLEVTDADTGKTWKSIPKRGADEEKYKKAQKDFTDLKKNVKKVVKNRADSIFGYFLSGKAYQAGDWKAVFLKNPVLNHVGRLIVWKQNQVCFTVSGTECVKLDGSGYVLTDDPVIVAHPMEMSGAEIIGWRDYFRVRDLKQPFIQMWEPVYDRRRISEDRYKGVNIPYYRFLNQEKHGITIKEYSYRSEVYIELKDCRSDIYMVSHKGPRVAADDLFEIHTFRFGEYNRQVNHLVAYFDRATVFQRIKNDDISVVEKLNECNAEQILSFISAAREWKAYNVLAALLDYRNRTYPNYEGLDSLILDL